MNDARVSEYPVTTHCSEPTPAWKEREIGWQRDPYHGCVQRCDTGAEYGGRDHPAAPRRGVGQSTFEVGLGRVTTLVLVAGLDATEDTPTGHGRGAPRRWPRLLQGPSHRPEIGEGGSEKGGPEVGGTG